MARKDRDLEELDLTGIPSTEQRDRDLLAATYQQPALGLDNELGALVAANDPFQALGQQLGVDPFIQPAVMPEVDMSEQVQPLDPAQVAAEERAAAGDPLAELPDLDNPSTQMVDKKVGSESTTVTQQERSAETAAAEQDLKDAQALNAASIGAEAAALDRQAKAEADLDEADQKVIATIETARAEARQEAMLGLQKDLDDINVRVAELTNTKPETFWGSKTAADKINASLSVGLGAMSQALLGSGQNVGMVLLQRQMQEFDTIQERKYQAQIKQIEGMRASLSTKMQLANDAEKAFDAQKLAARAQVQAQLGRGVAMAKTATVKAALGQKQAKFDQDIAKLQMDQAAKYEAKRTSNEERDVIQKVQRQAGMTKDGKPMTEGQTKAYTAYGQMRLALKNISDINEEDPAVRDALTTYARDMQALSAAQSVPVGGQVMNYANLRGYDTALDRLAQRSPEAYRYVQNLNRFTNAKLRQESGAAISIGEYLKEYESFAPGMQDSPRDREEKKAARIRAAKSAYTATGL